MNSQQELENIREDVVAPFMKSLVSLKVPVTLSVLCFAAVLAIKAPWYIAFLVAVAGVLTVGSSAISRVRQTMMLGLFEMSTIKTILEEAPEGATGIKYMPIPNSSRRGSPAVPLQWVKEGQAMLPIKKADEVPDALLALHMYSLVEHDSKNGYFVLGLSKLKERFAELDKAMP